MATPLDGLEGIMHPFSFPWGAGQFNHQAGGGGPLSGGYSQLSHVVRLGPVRPGALAQAIKMQPSTLTRNLQTLVRAGWVKVGVGSDARSRSVTATDAGREKRTQAQRHWKLAQQQINRVLGDARFVALHAQLEQALALLAAHAQTEEDARHGA